jgi:hypothetical protein
MDRVVLLQTMHDVNGNSVAFSSVSFSRSPRTSFRAPLNASAIAKLNMSPRVRDENMIGNKCQRTPKCDGYHGRPQVSFGNLNSQGVE